MMRGITVLFHALLLCGSVAGAFGDSLVIAGGTVHPVVGETFVGRVVVDDGIISAVGPNAEAPADATILDAVGLHVYPGLFDALGQLGLLEVGAVAATDDRTEIGDYNPHLRAATAVHPASEVIPVTRANGITHAITAPRPSRDGVISGQAALIHLGGWTIEEMAIEPAIAMVLQWPPVVTRRFDFSTFSYKETPFNEAKETAEEKQQELRDWLEAARHYAQAMAIDSPRTERDLKLEALAEVVEGRQPLIVIADAPREIEAAVEFAEEEGLHMILAGGREAWKVKQLLADKQIPVILGLTESLPREEDDPYDLPYRNPTELAAAGVQIAFASGAGGGYGPGGPHSARTLPYQSAMATAYGLSEAEALAAVTLNPARILGVDDRLGSIEVGKIANLIVTDGSPLEITTRVHHLIIAGREVSTANRHDGLFRRYRGR